MCFVAFAEHHMYVLALLQLSLLVKENSNIGFLKTLIIEFLQTYKVTSVHTDS